MKTSGTVSLLVLLTLCIGLPLALADGGNYVAYSCPFFNRSICERVDPQPDECCDDSGCSNKQQLCCFKDCRKMCVYPVKPGNCPDDRLFCPIITPNTTQISMCKYDGNCDGYKKCCPRCGLKCVAPVKEHAGSCPTSKFRIGIVCTKNITNIECEDDSACAPDEKCCGVPVCTTKCVKAVTEINYVCPKPPFECKMLPVEKHCDNDKNCTAPKKCCRLPCSIGCTDPVKPGTCPPDIFLCRNITPPPEPACKVDKDCEGNLKCCDRCGKKCLPPTYLFF